MAIPDSRAEGQPTQKSADQAAWRIWVRAAGDSPAPEQVAATAERINAQLRAGLGRWIGIEGYRALLQRALVQARRDHPALGGFSSLDEAKSGATVAVGAYGADAVAAGMVALMATLIDLLGGIIGGEMALRLVEQVAIQGPRRVESNKTNGRRDA